MLAGESYSAEHTTLPTYALHDVVTARLSQLAAAPPVRMAPTPPMGRTVAAVWLADAIGTPLKFTVVEAPSQVTETAAHEKSARPGTGPVDI